MKPSKRLGQHWLVDARQIRRFVEFVPSDPEAWYIEVGPGTGNLTVALAPKVPRLLAIELDARLLPGLRARCAAFPHVGVVDGDILEFEPLTDRAVIVVGAIPYQITSPLLGRFVTAWKPRLARAYLIVQREVAQRLAAEPGTKAWGALTCLVQYHFQVRLHWHIPPGAFRPPPRVHSSVVELVSRTEPPCRVEDETLFFALITQLFQTRRKTLWNTLRSWDRLRLSERELRARLEAVGIAPTIRGETLSLAALARLSNALR